MKKESPAPVIEKTTELEKVVGRKAKPEMTEGERRVKELRDEIMDELARLEQIDVDKNQQET
jgi:hypothetical protein